MKIHLLRRESVTPIAIYIARCDEQPDSFDRWLDFAALLLYREREYRSMYGSGWLVRGLKPAPAPDSPFQPYDLTTEAEAFDDALDTIERAELCSYVREKEQAGVAGCLIALIHRQLSSDLSERLQVPRGRAGNKEEVADANGSHVVAHRGGRWRQHDLPFF